MSGEIQIEYPKEDVEALLNVILEFAEQMLIKYGELVPCANAMSPADEISSIGLQVTEGNSPNATEIIEELRKCCRIGAHGGDYRCVAICFDVHLRDGVAEGFSSALEVAIDHKDEYSMIVTLPYRLENGYFVYGETFSREGNYLIFGPPSIQ
ncbi:MAG: hypothetical protein ABL907_12455 [Hyphomicrobium sp.]